MNTEKKQKPTKEKYIIENKYIGQKTIKEIVKELINPQKTS